MPPSFEEIYDEHVWSVYGFFAYRLSSRVEAEDLTQQTFERALRAWSRYDEHRARPLTWLMAIAHNALIDHYRKTGGAPAVQTLEESDEPAVAGPESSL